MQVTKSKATADVPFRAHHISTRILLVRNNQSRFANTLIDKSLTKDILEQSGCEAGSATGRKVLFAPEYMRPVTTPYSQRRDIDKAMCFPWSKGGWKGIPTPLYDEYLTQMALKGAELDKQVLLFADNLDEYIDAQRGRLAGLFNIDDYPTRQQFIDAWAYSIETDQVPSNDIRVAVDKNQAKDIQEQIEGRVNRQFSKLWQDAANRLAEGVAHVAGILTSQAVRDKDGNITKKASPMSATLLENLRVQVETVREMAVACDDKSLLAIANDCENQILQVPRDTLAANPGIKEQVGKDAAKLAELASQKAAAVDATVTSMLEEFGDF